jgi:hypothetical protein
VIVDVPAAIAVTTPAVETVATPVLEDVQGVEAFAVAEPVKVLEDPTQADNVPEMVGLILSVTVFEVVVAPELSVATAVMVAVAVVPVQE